MVFVRIAPFQLDFLNIIEILKSREKYILISIRGNMVIFNIICSYLRRTDAKDRSAITTSERRSTSDIRTAHQMRQIETRESFSSIIIVLITVFTVL